MLEVLKDEFGNQSLYCTLRADLRSPITLRKMDQALKLSEYIRWTSRWMCSGVSG